MNKGQHLKDKLVGIANNIPIMENSQNSSAQNESKKEPGNDLGNNELCHQSFVKVSYQSPRSITIIKNLRKCKKTRMARSRQPKIRSKKEGSAKKHNNDLGNHELPQLGIVKVSNTRPTTTIMTRRKFQKMRCLAAINVPSRAKNSNTKSNRKIAQTHKKHVISPAILRDVILSATKEISSLKNLLQLQKALTKKKIIENIRQKEKYNKLEIEIKQKVKFEIQKEGEIELLNNDKHKAEIQTAHLTHRLGILEKDNDILRNTLTKHCAENERVNDACREKTDDKIRLRQLLQNSNEEKQSTKQELEKSMGQFQKEREQLVKENELLQGKIDEAEEEKHIVEKYAQYLNKDNHRILAKMDQSESVNKQLLLENKGMEEEILRLNQIVRSSSTNVKQETHFDIQAPIPKNALNLTEYNPCCHTSCNTENFNREIQPNKTANGQFVKIECANSATYISSDDVINID